MSANPRYYKKSAARKSAAAQPKRAYVRKPLQKAPARSYYGKYKKPVYAGASSLPYLGGAAGGYFGGPPGALIGTALGKGAEATIKGFGDYTVRSNTLVLQGQTPIMNNSRRSGGGVLIQFKEFLLDVISSSSANTFDLQSYLINPTEPATFPWLSQIASNYQEFIFHGIVFHYKSMSGDALNSTNTALGQIIMATNYDPSQPDFGSKSEMENTEFSQSVRPSADCLHMIECARSASVLSNLYTTDASGHADPRFNNLGKFEIATNGFQGTNVNAGELWVTYSVELLKPKLFDTLGGDVSIIWISSAGVVDASPLGTSWALHPTSNLNVISPTATRLTLPFSSSTKQYYVQVTWRGSSAAALANPGFTLTNGATSVEDVFVGATGVKSDEATGQEAITGSNLILVQVINVLGGSHGAQIQFDGTGTVPDADCRCDIKIIELPNTFVTSTGDLNGFLESQ